MPATTFSGKLIGLAEVVRSAVAASAATRSHRQPNPADLRRLGIDPKRFREINLL